jgi:hypothetical protein
MSTLRNVNRLLNIDNSLEEINRLNLQSISNTISKTNNIFSHIFIDVNNITEFNKDHLETLKEIVNVEAWPELYGDGLPEGMRFTGFQIIGLHELDNDLKSTYNDQSARVTENPKYDEIKNDILTNGFKLRYPPIQVKVIEKNNNKYYSIINGRTRAKILKNNTSVNNVIVSTYTVANEHTFKTQSLKFNCLGVPEASATSADVIKIATQLISEGSLKKKLSIIREWLFNAVGNGIFTDDYKERLAQSIYNNAHLTPKIYSWRPETVDEWMVNHNFMKAVDFYNKTPGNVSCGLKKKEPVYINLSDTKEDQNKIVYTVLSHSTPAKNIWRIARILSMNFFKGKTLRGIIHTSTLTGSATTKDLVDQYENNIEIHNSLFNQGLSNISESFFCNKEDIAPKVNTTFNLYASLPAISSEHSMDELVIF